MLSAAACVRDSALTAVCLPPPPCHHPSHLHLKAPQPRSNQVVKFYRNGIFTVNDGPPRPVADPANMDFMAAVSRGECPAELDPGPGAEPVTVNLLRVEEDYEMPKWVGTGCVYWMMYAKGVDAQGRQLEQGLATGGRVAAAGSDHGDMLLT